MADIEFVSGLIVKAPHPKAPDFVKAGISIKVEDLKQWLDCQSGEWVNIDVKEAKNGKWYAAVSTYEPKSKEEKPSKPKAKPAQNFDDDDSDLPF